jgi:hypothetical protein
VWCVALLWATLPLSDLVPCLEDISASGPAPHPMVILFPKVSDSVCTTGLVSGSVTSAESPTVTSQSLGCGLSKSQI